MFLIFGGSCYYASGGAYDLLGCESDLKDALVLAGGLIGKEAVQEKSKWADDPDYDTSCVIEWTHVLNTESKEIVFTCGERVYGAGKMTIEIREKES